MEPHACPSCDAKAVRIPPRTLGYTFNQTATTNGPVPQNTGVSSYDYNVDRIVGSEAADKWGVVEKREAVKRALLRDTPGTTKEDLSALPGGSYRMMDPAEKQTTRNTRAFHSLAAGLAKSKDRYRVLQQISEKGGQ